ncbi:MAG: glycoside hydrolase family 9 protein [Melioribacter sp.]|uniref:glycoside hydrolase family 9 protein n=1 Tax=Melioribacter sp. TaxID=2052167 RepID=UPI003BD90162
MRSNKLFLFFIFLLTVNISAQLNIVKTDSSKIYLNSEKYYEAPGFNLTVFDDFYPEGHQGGITIIRNDERIAANGDLRLEPTPGQWSPVPKMGEKIVDNEKQLISVELWFPDSSKNCKGFNPIVYPDLKLKYKIQTEPINEGASILVTVKMDEPLPSQWDGKIGFNLELFPGYFFGKYYLADGKPGAFPRDPILKDSSVDSPLVKCTEFVLEPGTANRIAIKSLTKDIELYDGRITHNNGWFILRTIIDSSNPEEAVKWVITPHIDPSDSENMYKPVIKVSQVGYHPAQKKQVIIETAKDHELNGKLQLQRIGKDSVIIIEDNINPEYWGRFLRYNYYAWDFTNIRNEGLYRFVYFDKDKNISSNIFLIDYEIFSEYVWQPTVEYFLPIQMCHMRVNENYRVWHGRCHMDDAVMAPVNHNHFDGYVQSESTLTRFESGSRVPGLNKGGWHDAGDFDLRIESQSETVYKLSLAYELFRPQIDVTTIDQKSQTVEIHIPDGKNDILQQIEHGLLSIVGAYESMGRLYRGIICRDLRQYVLLGDPVNMTDNIPGEDDRWVFTENYYRHELGTAQALAAAYRVMKNFNPVLADKCLKISAELFERDTSGITTEKLNAAAELYLSTQNENYKKILFENREKLVENIFAHTLVIGRITDKFGDDFKIEVENAIKKLYNNVTKLQRETPFGVPYKPYIWGAGWGIQAFGVSQLFLHLYFPDAFESDYLLNSLNFILGVHPGKNNASFVSGIGVNSLTTAYGFNRADWSYIPGGIGSGTALIRPDLPELKIWPYLWQQTEYVLGGGTVDYILLSLGADKILNNK